MIRYDLTLVITPKDQATAAGVRPDLPSAAELCDLLAPLLAKGTERHALIGFTVTEVTTS